MAGLTKEQLAALGHKEPEMPPGMFLTLDDQRKIAAGLLADGLDVNKLSPQGRAELRTAIDIIIRCR